MNKIVLTDAERAVVSALVDEVFDRVDVWDPVAMVDEVPGLAERLPLRLREFLVNSRMAEADVTVVANLPVDENLVPTPIGWDLAAKTGAGQREELVLLLCGTALADPFGWATQQDGRVVHDVCPAPGMENSLTSASSAAPLTLHTEDVHHPCRGDYVSLFCLRNPDAVGTTFVRIAALDLPAGTREVLAQNRFRFHPDDSHIGAIVDLVEGEVRDRVFDPGSVIFGPAERPYLRFDVDFMSAAGGDTEAEQAIQTTVDCLARSVERVILEPGDAVFVDNYRVVHGREPFVPRYDGNDRWLKRLNLIRDVRRLYAMSDTRSRIIA
ncbi:TauD/TfdA family dioxygenase [Kibdelosporangium aridum]|uniref:Arginine beta-hydroxylase, Fe(II)/alpha-ketoglutarate-dependent n=1 Tax=Kibdelosporangium aridum TaxID=2030 RepID=A0A1Y5X4B2_KIBAR|nr:TauD/TfdA family dioxygenase [Kibdelosporangium aridum]SMC64351.1 arginine beta-hydroxylase, Fe(II)/alpha-ketoglutarate-dependent [Kibdelosporangium aridum]